MLIATTVLLAACSRRDVTTAPLQKALDAGAADCAPRPSDAEFAAEPEPSQPKSSGYGRGGGGLAGRRAHAPDVIPGQANIHSETRNIIRSITVGHSHGHRNEVKLCYEYEMEKDPTLAGRVEVQFTISAQGEVIAAVVAKSTMNHPVLERCVVAAVRRWKFPKPLGGGIVIVSYPFNFSPGPSAED